MTSLTDFDIGSLIWVKAEIDQALDQAAESLRQQVGPSLEAGKLRFSLTHLHQVTGAINMVGLDALGKFSEELELVVQAIDRGEKVLDSASVEILSDAIAAFKAYLEDLVNTRADATLALFPYFKQLREFRGEPAREADLFFPDLNVGVPPFGPGNTVSPNELVGYVKNQRSRFQLGLLQWLRDSNPAGLQAMFHVLRNVARVQVSSMGRGFWWSGATLIEVVAYQGVVPDADLRQVFTRLDMQLRRAAEGSAKVAERLFRDMLYYIAVSKTETPNIKAVRQAFKLLDYLPEGALDLDRAAVAARAQEAKNELQQIKDSWTKYTGGNAEKRSVCLEGLDKLEQAIAVLGQPDFIAVISKIKAAINSQPKVLADVPAMEVATALLLLENALQCYPDWPVEFSSQAGMIQSRLQSVIDSDWSNLPAVDEISMVGEATRLEQEKQLQTQVAGEIRANLQHIEQTLDSYFRQQIDASELLTVTNQLKQIQGALAILDMEDAQEVVGHCAMKIVSFTNADGLISLQDHQEVADGLSALGFYIDEYELGRDSISHILNPILARIRGVDLATLSPVQSEETLASQSVEAEIAAQKNQALQLLEALREQPESAEVKEQLVETLSSLHRNADLVADSDLVENSKSALQLLESEGAETEALHEAITGQEAPEPAAEEDHNWLSDEAVDAELLEIYLEEAQEVLANISAQLELCKANAHDKEALTVIRRSFHTLKGSGRMVGLNNLGDVAWAIEQILNGWLQEERSATPPLLYVVEEVRAAFQGWVETLLKTGSVRFDPKRLTVMAEVVSRPDSGQSVEELIGKVDALCAHAGHEHEGVEAPTELPEIEEVRLEPAAEAEASADIQLPDLAQEPEEIVIGSVAISPVLFEIFAEEAQQHLAELKAGLLSAQSHPDSLLEDKLLYAAHTLRGIAHTTGFGVLGDLGEALETWLAAAKQSQLPLSPEQLGLLHIVVIQTEKMVLQILSKQWPDSAEETIALLNDDLGNSEHSNAEMLQERFSETDVLVAPAVEEENPALLDFGFNLDAEVPSDSLEITPSVPSELPVIDTAEDTLTIEVPTETEVETEQEVSEAVDAFDDLSIEFDLDSELPETAVVQPDEEIELILDLPADDVVIASPVAEAEPVVEEELALEMEAVAEEELVLEAEPVAEEELVLETEAIAEEELVLEAEPVVEEELVLETEAVAEEELVLEAEPVAEEELVLETEAVAEAELVLEAEPVAEEELVLETEAVAGEELVLEAEPVVEEELVLEAEPVAEEELVLETEAIAEEELVLEAEPVVVAEPEAPVFEPVAEAKPWFTPYSTENIDNLVGESVIPGVPEATLSVLEHALAVKDDIDEQLLPIFIEEGQELLPEISSNIRLWRENPALAEESSNQLKRLLHTLKGSARMAGAMRLGEATHHIETRLIHSLERGVAADGVLDDLEADADILDQLFDALVKGEVLVSPAEAGLAVPGSATDAGAVATVDAPEQKLGQAVEQDPAKAQLRVRADVIDRLVNDSGEVAIARSRIEAEMIGLKRSLHDLTENVGRLRAQLREIEIQAESQMQSRLSIVQDEEVHFDPLEFDRFTRLQELTRFMAESVNDVATIQFNLLNNLGETEAALQQQGRMTKELQQQLMRIRMVPFSNISERLYRIVRQTGKEVGKKVNLEFRGGRVEIDRSVLEKMTSPFEHMLRNSIDHGLETREERLAAGKPEVGEVRIDARQEGNELILTLQDDGKGINLERVRQKGIEKGLIQADQQVSEEQLVQLIFAPGFSTAQNVTQVSGRGIGMDVVRNEIVNLGGRLEVQTTAGHGSIFTIHLPLTLAVTHVVLVRVAESLYAIPSIMVEQVQELKLEPLGKLYEKPVLDWMGNLYPFSYMARLLGDDESSPETRRYNTILLVKSGNQRIALHVDELVKNLEVVVKNIGPQLARAPGVTGATVLGNGQIVLILNPVQLLPMLAQRISQQAKTEAPKQVAELIPTGPGLNTTPVVMVVDDSLTVRKITGRLLEREGYQVMTAKDGVDALQQLQEIRPDVMLVDIEMPRMDGFELTRNVRSDAETRDIPIIMISSRTADKHKNYAYDLGVNVFLGKPYQEDELLGHISDFSALRRKKL